MTDFAMKKQWKKTYCARFDHGGCGLKVLVDGGKAIRVLPDKTNPRSKGYACAKGMASLERINHPQRLLHPLRRKGERGEGQWEEISWDEALEYAAMKLNQIKEEFGPQAVAFAQGAPKGLEYLLMIRLANVFGSPNMATTGHICHWPREFTGRITCGFLPVPDYENTTNCIMLWGSNPFHTNEEGILGVHLKRSLMENRPKLMVIDPYMTKIARQADLWLQIKPGTDDLLALGFAHIISNEGLYDEDFVQEWTIGFDGLKDEIQQYTPQMVSEGTWVPEEKIYQAARLYASSKPAIIHWGNAIENNGTNTSQTCRALIILMAITGNLDVPGGNIQAAVPRVMSVRKFIGADHSPENIKRTLSRHYGISPRLPFLPSSLLVKTILEGKPYPIKNLFVLGSNPLITYAGADKVFQALKKLDFIMIADLFITPTVALADLVLPAATNMEYNDIGHYGLPHGYILARPKIVEARGECWSDIKIINELGKRLGLKEFFWENIEECLEQILAPSGMNFEEFCQQGILEGEKRFHKYKKEGFHTPSGKVEIYSSIMKKEGYHPLPTAKLTQEPNEAYPLFMINAKPNNFFHSGYRHIKSLRKKHEDPSIRIHPLTASKELISNGDRVAIISPHGRIHMKAVLTEYLHPRVVSADYGWWFPEKGEARLFGWRESNLNILIKGDVPYDPVLGSIPLRNIPCRIEKGNLEI